MEVTPSESRSLADAAGISVALAARVGVAALRALIASREELFADFGRALPEQTDILFQLAWAPLAAGFITAVPLTVALVLRAPRTMVRVLCAMTALATAFEAAFFLFVLNIPMFAVA